MIKIAIHFSWHCPFNPTSIHLINQSCIHPSIHRSHFPLICPNYHIVAAYFLLFVFIFILDLSTDSILPLFPLFLFWFLLPPFLFVSEFSNYSLLLAEHPPFSLFFFLFYFLFHFSSLFFFTFPIFSILLPLFSLLFSPSLFPSFFSLLYFFLL